MSEASNLNLWKKLALEGSVIVISILLAFAIDAWWEERQDEVKRQEQLVRVAAEIRTNHARIQQKIETMGVVIDAASEFLSWMGPNPEEVAADRVLERFDRLIRVGTLSLTRAAVQDYLSVGRAELSGNQELRYGISNWQLRSLEFQEFYDLMRDAHAELIRLMNQLMPSLHFMKSSPYMDEHPDSRFPFVPEVILDNPKVESYVGHYLIRIEIAKWEAERLQAEQEELLEVIEASLDR